MAGSQAKSSIKETRRQGQGKQPKGIKRLLQQSVRKSARLEERQQQTVSKGQATKPKPALPSPLTSNTPSKEVPQSSPILPKCFKSREWTQTSSPSPNLQEIERPCSQHGQEPIRKVNRKRKRSQTAEDLTPQLQDKPTEKRVRLSSPGNAIGNKEESRDSNSENDLPIEHWRKTGSWPRKLFQPNPNMSQQLTKKRSSSAISYTQSIKQGENPPAYTPDYEKKVLAPAGIIMDFQTGDSSISDEDKKLCITLVQAQYDPPENSLFADDVFVDVINSIRSENEARVVRDIGPYITPSAEHLRLRGAPKFKHLKESIQADWTQYISLVDPRPRPDFMVGFSSSAFSCNEMKKLEQYKAPQNPTEFIGNLYFPFLTCEVNCGASGLNYADRQNIRNASTAVYAILQLYQGGDESRQDLGSVSRAHQLHRKVLVFSISHDHTQVNIYGHYALIGIGKTTFHRYKIRSFDLVDSNGRDRWTAYNFVRKLYDDFALTHLKRIQDAISLLPEKSESLMSITSTEVESDLPDSQETASAPASQDNEGFIIPALPPRKKRQNKNSEIAVLHQELEWQRQESEQQREESRQREGQLREELAREKEENKQRHTELMERIGDLLKQRLG